MEKILEHINSPEEVRTLDKKSLHTLCTEIREYMVDCCSTNPGHLGASLGAVELIVGIHYVFRTPQDKVVFDVSHQAYAHKILTGRKEAFKNNRKKEGISGFTRIEESPYDAFGAGHSSTSISAALGFAAAARMKQSNEKAIALIGDGALTGGMAYEGLNNAGIGGEDILIILNDNNISIDQGIGALHNYLLKITTHPRYNQTKDKVWNLMGEGKLRRFVQKSVRTAKSFFVKYPRGGFFEAMGFRYFGPIDGNNIEEVVDALEKLRDIKGPKILHAITTKGKGYSPAEEDQTTWHAPGLFDAASGKRTSSAHSGSRYQDVFGEVLLELAKKDKRIVGVTPAMASGCGMNILAEEMPERFYDVGIAEEHAVTFSAALAAGGMVPFCNIYSSFSQRAYDQIIHDCALQKLPVVLCFDRAGLVGEDGATHHGAYDMAAYRSVPGVCIAAPSNEKELKNLLFTASKYSHGPFILRYPRGYGEGTPWRECEFEQLPIGKGRIVIDCENPDLNIVAEGPCVGAAIQALQRLETGSRAEVQGGETGSRATEKGGRARVRVIDIRYIKPLDEELLQKAAADCPLFLSIEDGCLKGGLHGALCEWAMSANAQAKGERRDANAQAKGEREDANARREDANAQAKGAIRVEGLGIPDCFIEQGTQKELRRECSIDCDGILSKIQELLVL